MTLMRMPLFTWTSLCTSLLMVFAFPGLTVAAALLALDRLFGMHFFTNDAGGNMMNYINLLWIWGHPEVYILILPAFGVYSEVTATFARKRLFGYASIVCATMATPSCRSRSGCTTSSRWARAPTSTRSSASRP
jgi:cytochrome o ubiquinol oxidase subunit 1